MSVWVAVVARAPIYQTAIKDAIILPVRPLNTSLDYM
jgi:hypothetical protein